MFSSKQTHMFNYFICYHLESGWHVTRPNQVFLLGEEENGNEVVQRLPKISCDGFLLL